MKLLNRDIKVGDEVELYLDEGYVTDRCTDKTIRAILIGYREDSDEYIFGFKGNESRPKDAYVRSDMNRNRGGVSGGYTYLEDHGDFIYAYRACVYGGRWQVANVVKNLNNWRHWRAQKKGECPCGGNYGVCTYHPIVDLS